ncbi:hypothetical protein DACRYDRAFT_117769 [Dacryopinax primogenitus]|uniref:Cora-domain-containing protein n=1 Tax=Dacryopinax primogenitus (strain DJM 731) TaxID=1858805 RepID=M5G142_DACPD|nr:uncharacterized protein DACRYDRAFT_117769 [Dacryopinax primogenitus]EJT99541.1 hypothetical protein DACRYDRAFT_117769 [Dacryopinax primogenitus]
MSRADSPNTDGDDGLRFDHERKTAPEGIIFATKPAFKARYIEVFHYHGSLKPLIEEGELNETNLEAWLESGRLAEGEDKPREAQIRVLLCQIDQQEPGSRRLPFDSSLVRCLLLTTGLSRYFWEVMCENYDLFSQTDGMNLPYEFQMRLKGGPEEDLCLGATYDSFRQVTHVVIFVSSVPWMGADKFISTIVQGVKDNWTHAWHPMLVPLLVLKLRRKGVADSLNLKGSAPISEATHHVLPATEEEDYYRLLTSLDLLNDSFAAQVLSAIPRLHALASRVATWETMMEASLRIHDPLLKAIDLVIGSPDRVHSRKPGEISSMDWMVSGVAHQDEERYLRSLTENLLPVIRSKQRMLQGQISLMTNLLAQREGRLNMSVALDSKSLAVKSKRDSNSMKIIAILTMVFLPGTFTAALFAMPFFQWDAPIGEPVVATRFWIYWAVTLPLTLAVLLTWFLWTSDIWPRTREYLLDLNNKLRGALVPGESRKDV